MGQVEVKSILLTSGDICFVDAEDYPLLSRYTWHATNKDTKPYAVASSNVFGARPVLMHRLIMHPKKNEVVDHINGESLDNRKSNLRNCLVNENLWNSKSKNKHGIKGIVLRATGSWSASIRVHGERYHIGTFATAKEAGRAYDEAANFAFGKYANLNFPEELGGEIYRRCKHGFVLKEFAAERSWSCEGCTKEYFQRKYQQKKKPVAVWRCPHGVITRTKKTRTMRCDECKREYHREYSRKRQLRKKGINE